MTQTIEDAAGPDAPQPDWEDHAIRWLGYIGGAIGYSLTAGFFAAAVWVILFR